MYYVDSSKATDRVVCEYGRHVHARGYTLREAERHWVARVRVLMETEEDHPKRNTHKEGSCILSCSRILNVFTIDGVFRPKVNHTANDHLQNLSRTFDSPYPVKKYSILYLLEKYN